MPTGLRVIKGGHPERINRNAPIPSEQQVRCPAKLSAAAKAVWKQLAPDLVAKRVLTFWHVEAFVTFCNAVVLRDDAQRHLDTQGAVVDAAVFDRNGKPTGTRIVKSEWLGVWKDANDIMLRYGARFGLTPSDLAQLKVGGDADGSPKARLLS